MGRRNDLLHDRQIGKANILNTHAHKEMHTFVFDGVCGKYGIWMKKLYGMGLYQKSESKCTV